MRKMVIAALLIAVAAPAAAKTTFAAYEGPNSEYVGEGGTKVTMQGIEMWTAGRPPRKFKVLGIITDERKDKLLSGDPLNSKAVAKAARAAGGDALILFAQDSQPVGFLGSASAWSNGESTFGNGSGRVVNQRTTRFVVIRYLT